MSLTPLKFVERWRAASLSERSGAQSHFIDLCDMLGYPHPAAADGVGERFTFEKPVSKVYGGYGFADVWLRDHFAWEYKESRGKKHKDLKAAYKQLHILRPSGFEFIAELQEAIREAVPSNVASIQKDMPFVDFSNIEEYAASHTRAARYLSSIRSQRETQNISRTLLKKTCKAHGVDLQLKNGKITVLAGSEMDFLDILDRRMYELELVEGSPERYRASSRHKLANNS